MQVHWPIRFLKSGSAENPDTVTENLSSEGFHCLTKAPLVPGELSMCTLGVPAHDPKDVNRMLLVECKIRVVWARIADNGFYNVGCRIENYRFLDAVPSGRGPFRTEL